MCLSWTLIDIFLKFFKNRNWRCNFCTLLEHFYGSICSLMPLRINAQNSFAREAKFTEKHLCLSLFLIKLHVLFKRLQQSCYGNIGKCLEILLYFFLRLKYAQTYFRLSCIKWRKYFWANSILFAEVSTALEPGYK